MKGREFCLDRDPLENGFHLFKKEKILIKPGVTILVGCNGYGKTTFLRSIKQCLDADQIPCLSYDNLSEGGGYSRQLALDNQDSWLLANMITSSEGENICLNLSRFGGRVGQFISNPSAGLCPDRIKDALARIGGGNGTKKEQPSPEALKERWILLDAIDSGLSLDNIDEVKELFQLILSTSPGLDVYIVVSTNSYGFVDGANVSSCMDCFDSYEGEYVRFGDYEDYRGFILKTRKIKDERERKKKGGTARKGNKK